MPAPNARQEIQEIPLEIVGGCTFGRYPKISVATTINMIVSDDALVPYAGYKNIAPIAPTLPGRVLYASSRGNVMLGVWGQSVYTITTNVLAGITYYVPVLRGTVETSSGDIFVAENNSAQIAFTDGIHIYVYNWLTTAYNSSGVVGGVSIPTALKAPGYISFQNGRLIVANTSDNSWYLSDANQALSFPTSNQNQGSLQSKPDKVQAAVPTPGGGNNLVLFGKNVLEQWQDVGAALFPYQRSSTFNVDFGTLNASSIASLDNYVVWLAGNESSGAAIMVYSGNRADRISTDGIDNKLENLTNPENCTAFLFRQDGHIFYQFTFPDDNLSYAYDLNTKKFFHVTDENLNYHIARNVVYFNNKNYFVSLNGGGLFEFDTDLTDADYGGGVIHDLPRVRITPPFRLSSQRMYIIKSLGFTIENGQDNPIINSVANESVALSITRDGGATFSSSLTLNMNPSGHRRSRFIYQRLGQSNDTSFQIRFNGYKRFTAFNGVVEIYQ